MKLKATYSNYILECGTDEAGRGCLAGPVTAAAVILPANFKCTELNDSKQLSAKMRSKLKSLIEENAICYSVTHVCEDEIDSLNILNASITAMQRSVLKLNPKPEFISVDGNTFKPLENIPHKTIIKGDGKYVNIAAASILAKTYRDLHMETLHEEYPMYNWKKNKGYPTKEHREAIKTFGPSKYHRKSFRLLPQQYKLDF